MKLQNVLCRKIKLKPGALERSLLTAGHKDWLSRAEGGSDCSDKAGFSVSGFRLQQLESTHIIKTSKPLTVEANNADHLATLQCSAGIPWNLAFMWMFFHS